MDDDEDLLDDVLDNHELRRQYFKSACERINHMMGHKIKDDDHGDPGKEMNYHLTTIQFLLVALIHGQMEMENDFNDFRNHEYGE